MKNKINTLELFDIIVITGKSGVFLCKQPMRKFYDCSNGYQSDSAVVQAFSSATGVFGDAMPLYRSQLKMVRFAKDDEILAAV